MMDKNRISWTNLDWAEHLGCLVQKVSEYREWVNENYFAYVGQNTETKEYRIYIDRRHDTPSGMFRTITVASSKPFSNGKECAAYGRDILIPSLELSEFHAKLNGVPSRVLQLLKLSSKVK